MQFYDVAVVGGGVLGCFAARELCRYELSVLLIEAQHDLCLGISRANTAIIYSGCDNRPGSLKAYMTVRANKHFDRLCRELDVSFLRCGSLMVCYGEQGEMRLRKKLEQGRKNGVTGLEILSAAQARELEPLLTEKIRCALHAPGTGTVNPWQLGIAAWENASANGLETRLSTKLVSIERNEGGYVLHSDKDSYSCKAVVNCAGLYSDKVQELLFPPSTKLRLDGADFMVLDKHAEKPGRIIFQESEEGKGITAVPCVEGNLLLDSAPRPLAAPFASSHEGMDHIRENVRLLLPDLDLSQCLRSFGAVRPNPVRAGRNINDFCIERPEAGFISFIGIKTPGLSCAQELGIYAAKAVSKELKAAEKSTFDPCRKAILRSGGRVVCRCEGISENEILEAARRGARTAEGVKRRVGAMMGSCQGSRCMTEIEHILEDYRRGAL